jgi:hypothetical protein
MRRLLWFVADVLPDAGFDSSNPPYIGIVPHGDDDRGATVGTTRPPP